MTDFTTIQELKEYHIQTLIPCLIELEMGKELEAEVFINTLVNSVRRMTCQEIENQVLLTADDSIPVTSVHSIIENVRNKV